MENPNLYAIGYIIDNQIIEYDQITGNHKWTAINSHKPNKIKDSEAASKPDTK